MFQRTQPENNTLDLKRSNSRNRNLWFIGFKSSGLKFSLKGLWSISNHDGGFFISMALFEAK